MEARLPLPTHDAYYIKLDGVDLWFAGKTQGWTLNPALARPYTTYKGARGAALTGPASKDYGQRTRLIVYQPAPEARLVGAVYYREILEEDAA